MKKFTISQFIIDVTVGLFALMCFLPILLVLVNSFAAERSINLNGYSFFPSEWSTMAYKMMFGPRTLMLNSYLITIESTVIGAAIATFITFCAGYSLANKNCKYRNGLALYFFITMIFSAGLVPWYMVSKAIGAYNNIWALIIPSMLFSPFNMFLMRNYIKGIPESLHESARMDGAGDIRVAFQIYFPLCLPVIATITLFYALGYWNNYFNALMLVDDSKLYTLQMLLFKIQSEITKLASMSQGTLTNPPNESFKMATAVMTMGPIILLYPFLQRYFIKGMIVGAVKG
jgi:putative aldouronate transport system permease protein